MDGYSDETRYTITFNRGGYTHEVKTDGWLTADFTAIALSAQHERALIVNNFNGAEAFYRDGSKIWSDACVADLTA